MRIKCACPWCLETFFYVAGEDEDDLEGSLKAAGWENVEGEWYCAECADYSVDPETGEPLCETHDVSDPIEWGPIITRGPGGANYRIGRDSDGRSWVTYDRGGWTTPEPLPEEYEDEEDENEDY